MESLREAYPELTKDLEDAHLQGIIDGAKEWVGKIRYSWTVVASNKLRDGYFHAGLRGY